MSVSNPSLDCKYSLLSVSWCRLLISVVLINIRRWIITIIFGGRVIVVVVVGLKPFQHARRRDGGSQRGSHPGRSPLDWPLGVELVRVDSVCVMIIRVMSATRWAGGKWCWGLRGWERVGMREWGIAVGGGGRDDCASHFVRFLQERRVVCD